MPTVMFLTFRSDARRARPRISQPEQGVGASVVHDRFFALADQVRHDVDAL